MNDPIMENNKIGIITQDVVHYDGHLVLKNTICERRWSIQQLNFLIKNITMMHILKNNSKVMNIECFMCLLIIISHKSLTYSLYMSCMVIVQF